MRIDPEHAPTVQLAADVRRRLVEFALSPPYDRAMRDSMRLVTNGAGPSSEDDVLAAVDHVLQHHRHPDGSSVIDRFVARSDVGEDAAAIARGFAEAVDSIYEVDGRVPAGAELFAVRCCVAELEHLVAPTHPETLDALPQGAFLAGSLVPLRGTPYWTSVGAMEVIPAAERAMVAIAAKQLALEVPWLSHRDPAKLAIAQDLVATMHAAFVERHGTDLVVVPGDELPELYADVMSIISREDEVDAERRRTSWRSTIADSGLAGEDQVLVHCHALVGVSFYVAYEPVERALRLGAQADRRDVAALRQFLLDDTVPRWLVERVVTEHLPTSEAAFGRAMRKRDFSWERDGANALDSLPGAQVPSPSIGIVPAWCSDTEVPGRRENPDGPGTADGRRRG